MENKVERKTTEKNRRENMKHLCSKLVSLIPPQPSKNPKRFMSQQDQVGEAVSYINTLRERIQQLRRRKVQLEEANHATKDGTLINNLGETKLEIKELGSNLEVILISGANKKLKLHQIISIIEQEGAEVVTVTISKNGDNIFHTLHAQAKIRRVGVETSRIRERIHELL